MFVGFDDAILEAVLAIRPPVVSFHFGLPHRDAVRALKAAGAVVLCSATTVAEARRLEAEGADAVIAQGYEAGGHRGTFAGPLDAGTVATLPLVPQVASAVDVPVIAAGGIGDGRGIAAAFALGASGVQMGTAFLSCPEASVAPLYRQALLEAGDDSTRVTRVISGRPARGIRNRLVTELQDEEQAALAFPLQYSLTSPLAAASAARGSADFMALWAGQAVGLNRSLPAGELVGRLVEEARETFALLGPGAGST
jgi:nitronate monooxygenase